MTLRLRLVAVLVLATVLVAAAVGILSTHFLRTSLETQLDTQLGQAIQTIVQEENLEGEATTSRAQSLFPSRFGARIVDGDGNLVREIEGSSTEIVPDIVPADVQQGPFERTAQDGSTWRIQAVQLGEGKILVVGADTQDIENIVTGQGLSAVLVAIVAVAVAGGAGMFLVTRSLRPLREVERTAGRIVAGDLSLRVKPGRDDETRRLTDALNTMLGRLESSFIAQRASEERVRHFVSDASHELRTPLTTIRGFAELARQDSVGETAEALTRIEGEASRMGRLVEDLLLLARLDEQAPLQDEDVDLLLVALDTVADGRARGGNVHIAGGDEELHPVLVRGDSDRIRQVAANLLTNALEHSPEGTQVTLSVGSNHTQGYLRVADQGPGMNRATADRVFDRFYRADPSRNRATGGSGLGLSIVKAVVGALRGTVDVDTELGKGTVFTLAFPLSETVCDGTGPEDVPDETGNQA